MRSFRARADSSNDLASSVFSSKISEGQDYKGDRERERVDGTGSPASEGGDGDININGTLKKSPSLLSLRDAPEIEAVTEFIRRELRATKIAVFARSQQSGEYSCMIPVPCKGATLNKSAAIVARASAFKQAAVASVEVDPRLFENLSSHSSILFGSSPHQLLCAPVLGATEEVIGLVVAVDKANRDRFSDNDLEAAEVSGLVPICPHGSFSHCGIFHKLASWCYFQSGDLVSSLIPSFQQLCVLMTSMGDMFAAQKEISSTGGNWTFLANEDREMCAQLIIFLRSTCTDGSVSRRRR